MPGSGRAPAAEAPDPLAHEFEFWMRKLVGPEGEQEAEFQDDVALHLPRLREFLRQVSAALRLTVSGFFLFLLGDEDDRSVQIMRTMTMTNAPLAIQRFPLICQLLGRLCWNPSVIGCDESQEAVLACLSHLFCPDPRTPLEFRVNNWIRGLLCHLLSSPDSDLLEAGSFLPALGFSAPEYAPTLLAHLVTSLVDELTGKSLDDFEAPPCPSAERVRVLSLLCVPLLTLPDVAPLLEALLTHDSGHATEILPIQFLEAANEALMRKKTSPSRRAVVGLWLRHVPGLERAAVRLLRDLLTRPGALPEQLETLALRSMLVNPPLFLPGRRAPRAGRCAERPGRSGATAVPARDPLGGQKNQSPQASSHPAIFRIVDDVFRQALLESDGAPEVVTALQVFTRCFVQSLREDGEQRRCPLKAYFPHAPPSLTAALSRDPEEERGREEGREAGGGGRGAGREWESWFLLVHFGAWVSAAARQVLSPGAGCPRASLWLLAFYHSPPAPDTPPRRARVLAEARSLHGRLTLLAGRPALAVHELRAALSAAGDGPGPRPARQVARHLLLAFLLLAPAGREVAGEAVAEVSGPPPARDQGPSSPLAPGEERSGRRMDRRRGGSARRVWRDRGR
ncbi:Fanconi anemia group C protein [Ornithorhynchus anatinus]|uniref:Fanconi anemia group C protein n=1 Tax=Ornithorhynchus anatinus TaxID=9258 RepID=UPI0019D48BB2|nr:Fanconi anemia group C protein [Ornithorhynchus anatinus]